MRFVQQKFRNIFTCGTFKVAYFISVSIIKLIIATLLVIILLPTLNQQLGQQPMNVQAGGLPGQQPMGMQGGVPQPMNVQGGGLPQPMGGPQNYAPNPQMLQQTMSMGAGQGMMGMGGLGGMGMGMQGPPRVMPQNMQGMNQNIANSGQGPMQPNYGQGMYR